MKTCLKLSIFLLAMNLSSANGAKWIHEVISFLNDNGLKHVTLLENLTAPSPYARKLASNLYERANFFLRHSSIEHYQEPVQTFDVDFQIFLFDPKHDGISNFLKAIERTKVKRSVLLLTRPWNMVSEEDFYKVLYKIPNLFFYEAAPLISSFHGKNLSWRQIITLQTGYTINEVKFEKNSYTIIEKFDLGGLKIRSISLTWAPFLTINECNYEGTDCEIQYGYLMDYMETLAQEHNFTLENYVDQGRK